jgi:hypothetical protein
MCPKKTGVAADLFVLLLSSERDEGAAEVFPRGVLARPRFWILRFVVLTFNIVPNLSQILEQDTHLLGHVCNQVLRPLHSRLLHKRLVHGLRQLRIVQTQKVGR